jgi:hypothetical protein
VVPADMDKAASDAYQRTVYELAQQSGMRFQVRNVLAPQDVEPGLRIVIAVPPDPGIAALRGCAAVPGNQYWALRRRQCQRYFSDSLTAGHVAGYRRSAQRRLRAGMIMPKMIWRSTGSAAALTGWPNIGYAPASG